MLRPSPTTSMKWWLKWQLTFSTSAALKPNHGPPTTSWTCATHADYWSPRGKYQEWNRVAKSEPTDKERNEGGQAEMNRWPVWRDRTLDRYEQYEETVQLVKTLTTQQQSKVNNIQDKDGKCLAEGEDKTKRWTEYSSVGEGRVSWYERLVYTKG